MKNRQLIPANLFFVCIILVMLSAKIYAQPIAYYSFSSSNRPYESLQNGIELGDSFNRGISFSNVPLGFTFNFGGIVSSEIAIHAGGYIKVGAAFTYLFDNYSPLTDARTDDFIISPCFVFTFN